MPKYTKDDLTEMQAWPLERKIRVTQTRIIEWYQHYDGNVYVSFSGGKDSTVLLDLARRIYPDIGTAFMIGMFHGMRETGKNELTKISKIKLRGD